MKGLWRKVARCRHVWREREREGGGEREREREREREMAVVKQECTKSGVL